MYYLCGIDQCIKNIYCLASKFSLAPIKTTNDLKKPYLEFLKSHLPKLPVPENIEINFLDNEKLEKELVECYKVSSTLNDRLQTDMIGGELSEEKKQNLINLTKAALEELKKRNLDYYNIFNLVIHTIFFRQSTKAAGGSTTSALGVIWLSDLPHITKNDLLELFVHELTHNLYFIDELCHLHYSNYDMISMKNNFAVSALLHINRPIDKVMHSILVATELLITRSGFLKDNGVINVHPDSNTLRQNALHSIESIKGVKNIKSLMTVRGFDLLEKCETYLKITHNVAA